MTRKRITYIVSRVDKALEFEWAAEFLNREKFELSFIILGPNNNTLLKQKLDTLSIECKEIYLNTKSNYPLAVYYTYCALRRFKPDIVHCHLIDGTLIGLLAAKLAGVKNKMYTRHHSTFHHQYAPHAIKFDIWANRNADKIIAISPLVAKVLKDTEHADPSKIVIIPHGFPASTFEEISEERVEQLRVKYQLKGYSPVIGAVSRYDKWKGVEYIIAAFSKLIEKYPTAKLLLANASKGDSVAQIKERLGSLPVNTYCEIDFEPDNKALFNLMDVFIHVPVDEQAEAFGQVYVEAMANKVPVVGTRSGIGNELLLHLETGYVVQFKDSNSIIDGVEYVLRHNKESSEMVENGFRLASSTYTLSNKIMLLEKLYSE